MSRSLRIHHFRATMSSRSTYRGGRNQWRRSFSDRPPYNNNNNRGGHFVTGDSHLHSIRDSNLGLRQGNLYNQTPPPPFHQFRQPPLYSNRNPSFRQPPPFVQNQAVRPRPPKPLDYRNWEQAKAAPPPDSDRFLVLSYNILAAYLAVSHRSKLYYHIPRYILDWQWRKKSILFEIRLWSADIMCLQEVDRFQDLEEELRVRGYSGIWKMRTGKAIDGCAIFWRTSRFKLLFEESIEYNKLGLRDNVAQICVLELMSQKHTEYTAAPPTSSSPHNKVVVCNIHVLYNPKRGEIKLGQVRTLLDRAHAVSKTWDDAPVVICGDFNCTPKSPLYNFISEKKLDLSGVDRDKVSGQASAEIRASKPYNPNPRAQTADGSIQTPSVVGGVSVGVQSIDPLSDMQKNNKDGNAEICPFGNKLSPSQSTETVLGGSDKACIDMHGGNDDDALVDEVAKESKQNVGNGFKGETGSAFSIPTDSLKESLSYLQSKVRFPTNESEINIEIQEISTNEGEINVEIQEISTSPQSHPENKSDLTEMGQREKANATSFFNHGSISEQYESNFNKEIESSNIEDSTSPLVSNDHSSTAGCNPEMITASDAEISPTELSSLTCSNAIEVSVESFEKFSYQLGADDREGTSSTTYQNEGSSASTSIDILVTDQLENLSLSNLDESRVEVGSIDEDDNTFLSALHDTKDAFPPDLDQFVRSDLDPSTRELVDENLDHLSPSLDSEAADVQKTAYDPSLWTPMEIATATGNGDCTYLEHPLQLTSTYAEVGDCSGTRDTNGEPLVTSYNTCFLGTVDYIWRSEGLQTARVLAPIPKQAMQWTPGFPTKKWGSDHIALASEMAFTKP